MRPLALAPLFLLAVAASAAPGDDNLLSSSTLALRAGTRATMTFRARWTGALPAPDPAVGATLRVAGGPGEGDSGPVVLPGSRWRRKGQTLRYHDPTGSAAGVRTIVIRAGRRGGRIQIAAGAGWRFDLGTAPSHIGVMLTLGSHRWCTEFAGSELTVRHGKVRARTRKAPAACPCTGTAASTWDAVREVFAAHGCTSSVCHGASPFSGNLDLRHDTAYGNLVDVPSSALPEMKRVFPGSKDASLLWQKLAAGTRGTQPPAGSPMPSGNFPPLSENELRLIELWIYAGASSTGVVPGSERLLDACLPPPTPQKIPRPDPPAPGTGVELYGAPWSIPVRGEAEVCYATWYDVDAQVPDEARVPCPTEWGSGRDCFLFHRAALTQDPNSHHSILRPYRGIYGVDDPGWGTFTCHGGTQAGAPCNPLVPGVAAPGGADCGPGAGCAGTPIPSPGCIAYGPRDFSDGFSLEDSAVAPSIFISTQPFFQDHYADGVSNVLPTRGILVTNSHAFNPTEEPTTNEQWFQLFFSSSGDQRYLMRDLFDGRFIFGMDVPAFEEREICATWTFERGSRVFRLTSHTHKRGRLFRVWGPGIATPCAPQDPGCLPEAGAPILTTTDYTDPAQVVFDPPLALDGADAASRTVKYCAIYDNGHTDPANVRRRSVNAAFASPCSGNDLRCLGGPKQGTPCGGNDAVCGDGGVCDACPVRGGVSTEDEMFVLMGSYYCIEGSSCYQAAR